MFVFKIWVKNFSHILLFKILENGKDHYIKVQNVCLNFWDEELSLYTLLCWWGL